MIIIILCLTLSSWSISLLNANPVSTSGPLDIDYLPSSNTSSLHSYCALAFDLSMIGIDNWNNDNSNELILYWIHSHISTLIDSSFVYDVDEYTDDFWSEYYLHLTAISNQTRNTITLSIAICVTHSPLQDIIESVLENDGDEIAAFIRYKLSKEMGINDIEVTMMITDAIILFAMDTTSYDSTTQISIDTVQSTKDNEAINPFVFTENMLYIAVFGFCMIIISLIVTLFCMFCIKQTTDKKLDNAIKEMETHNKRKAGNNVGKELGDNDIISIEPIPIPSHLASIDTGLNRENVLTDIDDDASDSSMNIQRNKLGLSKKQMMEAHDASEIEELNAAINSDDIILSSSPSSLPNNTVFIEDTDYRGHSLRSMSARLSHQLHRSNNDDMNVIYNALPAIQSPFQYSRSMEKNTSKQIRKYRAIPRARHSMVGKQYAKRMDIEGNKHHKQIHNKRSHSKPNLRIKRPKLHSSYSQKEVFPRNNVFAINHSNSIHSLPHLANKNSLSVHSGNSMMLYQHKESVDVDDIEFENGEVKIDLNNLKALDPPIPNPEDIRDNINGWESESESSIVCRTNTTKGTASGLEGVAAHSINNSDAHSHNVSVIINDNETPPPPPPPPPPLGDTMQRMPQTVHIQIHDKDKKNNKFDSLSVIAVQSSVSTHFQPNF